MDTTGDWQSNKSAVVTNSIMFENEIATDVTFSFPNSREKVKAHKYVLMSRSQVFFRMFTTSGFQDSQGQIHIADIEPDMFKDFLRYLYCGYIRKDKKSNAIHMLYCAEKYGIAALRKVCLKQLEETISSSTVALFLEMAVMYNVDVLKTKCFDFFHLSCNRDLAALKNHHMTPNTLKVFIDHETIRSLSDKVAVFKACNTWANDECVEKGLDPTSGNKRKVLGGILPKIPFRDMTINEFANHVSPVGLLTPEEEVWMFRCLASEKMPRYFSENNLCPVTVKLPTEINIPNNITNGFQIEIKCSKKFRLVGFSFSTVGEFNIIINKTRQDFSVSEAGIEIQGDYGMDHELIIKDKWFGDESKRHGAVPFSVKCRDGQEWLTGKAYISSPTPFEAILVEFSEEV